MTSRIRAFPSPNARRVVDIPPGWRPVPAELRDTTPAPCDRCDAITRLPFGPGDALCGPCRLAELADRILGTPTHG